MAASIVNPYVKVFSSLYKQDVEFLAAVGEMVALGELFWSKPQLRDFLCTPALKSVWREALLRRVLKGAGVSELVQRMMILLLRKGRMKEFQHFTLALQVYADQRCGILRGTVESVVPLSADETGRLKVLLEKSTGKKTVLAAKANPDLLGGLKIRMNQMVLDTSLEKILLDAQKKLNKLRA